MASPLTREEVERIATLARLTLTPDEASKFARELTAILEYAADISRVDTTGVTPAGVVTGTASRPDQPAGTVSRDLVIDEAPDGVRDVGLFRVPKVL